MKQNMLDLYKQLSIDDQRNEFSALLMKIDDLLNVLINEKKLNSDIKVKNYDVNMGSSLSESDMLTFFYEDIWNLKNKILMLLTLESSKK